MNESKQQVAARFGPENRFAPRPGMAAALCPSPEGELEELKQRLLTDRLERSQTLKHRARLRGAADDAAALAWVTAFPLLLFPVLFEEKARAALLQAQRQDRVRERSRELMDV